MKIQDKIMFEVHKRYKSSSEYSDKFAKETISLTLAEVEKIIDECKKIKYTAFGREKMLIDENELKQKLKGEEK